MAEPDSGSGRPAYRIVERFHGVGSPVRIRRGRFAGFQGAIAKLLWAGERAKITILLGGHPAMIEVAFADFDLVD